MEKTAIIKTKYIHYLLESSIDDKEILSDIDNVFEEDGYTCTINMK